MRQIGTSSLEQFLGTSRNQLLLDAMTRREAGHGLGDKADWMDQANLSQETDR